MELEYYRQRAVTIHVTSGILPKDQSLCSFLEHFGKVCNLRRFRISGEKSVKGLPNTVMMTFDSPNAVESILKSSGNRTDDSFWKTHSLVACPLINTGVLYELFSKKLFPTLLKLNVHPSGISVPTQSSRSQPDNGNLRNQQPPSKRRRNEDWGRTLDSAISVGGQIPESNSSQISSLTPESPGWMRVRITKLEAELDTLRAARDMAVSEQNIIRTAHQAEQTARREAMAQKSAAEAALSRKEVEQGRLRAELDSALSQKEALSAEVDSLRRQLAAPEDRLKSIQSSSESTRSNEQIKTLETGLEDAQGRAHKLQLYGSHMEEKQETNDTTELDKMKTKVKRLKSEVKQLTSDLVTTQEQLESAQKSLESKERKCSSTRRRYENTKTKLGIYKARLENECALIQKLKETLTPAAYQSLGETHETLGAFLSAIGLPPVDEEGNGAPKEETQ